MALVVLAPPAGEAKHPGPPSGLFFLPFGAGCAMVGAAKGVREAWRRMEPRCGRSL